MVSHDRALLRLVDRIAEVGGGRLRFTTGDIDAHESALAAEQDDGGGAVAALTALGMIACWAGRATTCRGRQAWTRP